MFKRPKTKEELNYDWKIADLKAEKIAHKDLWAKFFSGEGEVPHADMFETEFEDKLLQIETCPLPESLKRDDPFSDSDYTLTAPFEDQKSGVCSL